MDVAAGLLNIVDVVVGLLVVSEEPTVQEEGLLVVASGMTIMLGVLLITVGEIDNGADDGTGT